MSTLSMGQNIVLQIAETRFAIRCNYPAFTSWLIEACEDFLVLGEPHARLNISFNITAKMSLPPNTVFIIIPEYDGNDNNFKIICSDPDEPNRLFRSILYRCLHCSVISKQPRDLWLHSSGVVYRGGAYVFTGPSGAGKSTICNILAKNPRFTILHDEVVVLSQNGGGFYAWSSPLQGAKPARYCLGAPLCAVFFLNHAETNDAARVNVIKVPGLLSANIMSLTTIKAIDGQLTNDNRGSLNFLLSLAESIPCYELYFKPDVSFWECIERLFFKEPTIASGKEQNQ